MQTSNEERKAEKDGRNYRSLDKESYGYEYDHFKNDSLSWQGKMSKDELNGVVRYSGSTYRAMNDYLRTGKMGSGYDEKLEKLITDCSNGLSKYTIKENLLVYRKSSAALFNQLGVSLGYSFQSREDFVKSINSFAGSIVTDKGFTSTSTRSKTWGGDVHMEIRVPKGTNGAYIEHVSQHSSEKELLLNKGTNFKIVSARMEDNHPVVVLKVINKSSKRKQ